MAVYGEEHHPIDISNGVWLSPVPDAIPNGYCQRITNFFKTSRNTWEARKGFREIWTLGINVLLAGNQPSATTPIPETEKIHVKYGELNGGPGLPQLWFGYDNIGGSASTLSTITGKRLSTDTRNYNDQPSTAALGIGILYDMAQYKDRIYAATYANTTAVSIFQVSNFIYNATSPAITFIVPVNITTATVLANTGVPDPVLFAYQDRMWLSRANRLTFTDVPLTGLYPDVWNAGANFINLPASGVSTPNIYNCLPLNGLLYIFTDKGIFVLNARNNDPTTWSVELVNPSICINKKHAVAIVNGIFVITTGQKLMSFDGSGVKNIGAPVDYLFNIYNSFSIVPFQAGFLFCCRFFVDNAGAWTANAPTGGDANVWSQSRSYYFNGTEWTEVLIGLGLNFPHVDPLFGAVNKQVSFNPQENISYIIGRDFLNSTYAIYYYDYTLRTDFLSGVTRGIQLYLQTKDVIPAAFVHRQMLAKGQTGISKIKYAFVKLFSLYTPGFNIYMSKNGSSVPTVSTPVALPVLASTYDNNFEIKIPGAEYVSRINMAINATTLDVPSFATNSLPSVVPFFELKAMVLVTDTDKRQEPDTITT